MKELFTYQYYGRYLKIL